MEKDIEKSIINNLEAKISDEYDLINSLSIGEYCRKIKHKFNTEELAVLIFRNKRMSIDKKISKYEELIVKINRKKQEKAERETERDRE